jgi:hypothetical protein
MDSIGSILPKVLHRRGLHGQVQASHVTHRAQEWLKSALPQLADQIVVDAFDHQELRISCSHPIAAQECQMLLTPLKDFLERECKGVTVREIRIGRKR